MEGLFTKGNLRTPTTYGEGLPPRAAFGSIAGKHDYPTVVIGGGLTGLTTALELARAGQKVLVLEALTVGQGPSGRNGGQVIPGFDWGMDEMAEEFGDTLAKELWDDVEASRARLHARIDAAPDKCDSMPGIIAAAMNDSQMEEAQETFRTLREKFNYRAAKLLDSAGIRRHINSDTYVGGMLYGDARHINPEKYMRELLRLAVEAGVTIAENTPVTGFAKKPGGCWFELTTPAGHITAGKVVVATGADFLRPKGLDFKTLPRMAVTTQTIILATAPDAKASEKAVPGTAAWFDLRPTMNYARRMPDHRVLFGGADATSLVEAFAAIWTVKRDLYETLPSMKAGKAKVEKFWTGNVDMSRTKLPFVRKLAEGLYAANGFSGQGLVLTGLAGEAIAEDILTGKSARLERLGRIAPEKFSDNAFLAKLQVVGENILPVIRSFFGRHQHPPRPVPPAYL